MKRTGFLARVAAFGATVATPLSFLASKPMAANVAVIEAEYPEFAPAEGNVVLTMRIPAAIGRGAGYTWRYSRPSLGTSYDEALGSVREMTEHAASNGFQVMRMSSVDNLLTDLRALR